MPGNIRKREGKRGISYVARIDVGRDARGKRMQESKSFRTKTEAQSWLTEIRHNLLSNGYVKPSQETVSELLSRWLQSRRDLTESSRVTYASLIRNHLDPTIGHIPLSKLSANHIQDAYNSRQGTIPRQVHQILNPALKWAVRRRQIQHNPCEGVIVPSPTRDSEREVAVWTADELRRLLNAAADVEPWHYPIFATLAASGLRPGEALALQWDDVDLQAGNLTVRRTVVRGEKGYVVVDRPKAAASLRTISIGPSTVEVLKGKWRELERIRHQRPMFGANYVFPSIAGRLLEKGELNRVLRKCARAAGVPELTPHALRYTHASLLLSAQRPLHYVQCRLGHGSAVTTLPH